MTFSIERLSDSSFKFTDYKESFNEKNDYSPKELRDQIIYTCFVKIGFIHQPKYQLKIEKSKDNRKWKELRFHYKIFEKNLIETIESMLAEKKRECTIPYDWIGGFELLQATKIALGPEFYKFNSAFRGLQDPDWHTEAFNIFNRLANRYWNKHFVTMDLNTQNGGQKATLSISYTDDVAERHKVINEYKQNFETIRRRAIKIAKKLQPGEIDRLKEHCSPSMSEYRLKFLRRQISEDIKQYGATMIRLDFHEYLIKKDI